MTQPGEFTYVQQPPRNLTYEQYLAEVAIVVAALFRVIAGIAIPYQFLLMMPYVVAIVALMLRRSRGNAPAMLGVPYSRE